MTDEQRERIKAAAYELSSALTDANCVIDVEVRQTTLRDLSEPTPRYIYMVHVVARHEEVIV